MMLFVVFMSFILLRIAAQNYCLFGRNGLNSVVNGLYALSGTNNGKPAYLKNIDSSCGFDALYLYYDLTSTRWTIANTLNATNYYAVCPQTVLSSCVEGNWLIFDGTGLNVDTNMFISTNSCPQWSCASITTTIPIFDDLCQGPFTKDTSYDNVWLDASNSLYLFYNPVVAEWICSNQIDSSCTPLGYAITDNYVWSTLSPGAYTDAEFTSGDTYRINCIDDDGQINTPSPTSTTVAPTKPPTTSSYSVTSWCIWNRADANGVNVGLNGLYEFDGDLNGHSSYKKTADSSCAQPILYLYRDGSDTEWRIGSMKGAHNYYNAWCKYADLSSCSAGRWTVVSGLNGNVIDANMHTISDSCPIWNCASITSTIADSACASFDEQIGVNTWKNSAGFYWNFIPELWIWRCMDSDLQIVESCSASLRAATDQSQSWIDLNEGESTALLYSDGEGYYTVSCSSATAAPTASPTKITVITTQTPLITAPITTHTTDTSEASYYPYASRTEVPSESPLNDVTDVASVSPTNNPTTIEFTGTFPSNSVVRMHVLLVFLLVAIFSLV